MKQLKSIPFDYREQHADLFTKEAMQSMIDKVVNNGHTSNSGNGNIVPIITNNNNANKITGKMKRNTPFPLIGLPLSGLLVNRTKQPFVGKTRTLFVRITGNPTCPVNEESG